MNGLNLLVGAGGEAYARVRLQEAGYVVDIPPERKQGDLRVIDKDGEIFKLEIKTSREGRDGKWQVCLNRGIKTSVRHADYVLIQLVMRSGRVVVFLIPAWVVATKKQITWRNPETPNSKWAQYRRQDYQIFGGVI
jgi:hypothetical protein